MRENCSGGGVQEGWNSQGDLEQRASETARRSERLTRDRKGGFESPLERRENFLLQGEKKSP